MGADHGAGCGGMTKLDHAITRFVLAVLAAMVVIGGLAFVTLYSLAALIPVPEESPGPRVAQWRRNGVGHRDRAARQPLAETALVERLGVAQLHRPDDPPPPSPLPCRARTHPAQLSHTICPSLSVRAARAVSSASGGRASRS